MKLHWKILIALVVGALITGQVVSFRAIAAMNENLENAHTALAAAQAAMEKANMQYETMLSQWNKMNKMSGMSAMDKEMMKVGGQAAATQKSMMDAMSKSLKATEGIWKYETGPK
jgi:signal recognition particle GTPase